MSILARQVHIQSKSVLLRIDAYFLALAANDRVHQTPHIVLLDRDVLIDLFDDLAF